MIRGSEYRDSLPVPPGMYRTGRDTEGWHRQQDGWQTQQESLDQAESLSLILSPMACAYFSFILIINETLVTPFQGVNLLILAVHITSLYPTYKEM